jgi:adsorption protein B
MLSLLVSLSLAALVWRATLRFCFTAREYGLAEGARGVLRIPVANLVAILAGRRALISYVRTLRGELVRWDKTRHNAHPARSAVRAATASVPTI